MNAKKILIIGLAFILCKVCVVRATVTGPHGDERIIGPKGVCANCHVPHEGTGPKIWAQPLNNIFNGVRSLCYSCHDGTFVVVGTGDYDMAAGFGKSVSGIGDVFDPDKYEDHVMHAGASLERDHWLGFYDMEVFPVDENDKDNVPRGASLGKYREGGSGFYCGSCHNVHQEPVVNGTLDLNGDYLRTKEGKSVGIPGIRKDFCIQCHDPATTADKNTHLENTRCLTCHHPHKGDTLLSEDEEIGRSIFAFEVIPVDFVTLPNVVKIEDQEDDSDIFPSSKCYACHQPNHLKKVTDPYVFLNAGAAPIFADYRADENGAEVASQERSEHHPMGDQARLTGGYFPRARGAAATQHLNANNELTCVSCHADVHGGTEGDAGVWGYGESKKNNFLRWNFINDNAEFCLKCHPSKATLVEGNEDLRHFWKNSSRLTRRVFDPETFDRNNPARYWKEEKCRQCMLCHFIHDGKRTTDVEVLSPDLDALMRVPPVNPFGQQDKYRPSRQANKVYYEDMCFGCHTNNTYVSTSGKDGSLLLFPSDQEMFSHRYSVNPNSQKPPYKAMIRTTQIRIEGKEYTIRDFPMSDGDNATVVADDYGAEAGQMYCGSCHDVHDSKRAPYLNYNRSEEKDVADTLFKPYGFCEDCHNAGSDGVNRGESGDFIGRTHPIDRAPNNSAAEGSPTVASFPSLFSQGGSGEKGGVLFDEKIICLTCHNTHAAKTAYEGARTGDNKFHGQLLVMDNYNDINGKGSEFCKACHESLVTNKSDFPSGDHGLGSLPIKYGTLNGGTCSACHIPHSAKGPKIWSRSGYPAYDGYNESGAPFLGYRQLCFTCHNGTEADDGLTSVFKDAVLGRSPTSFDPNSLSMDHVMHAAADLVVDEGRVDLKSFDIGSIPRDPDDKDSIPLGMEFKDYREGGLFYCGSCHNPHEQPQNSGDYLRRFGTTNTVGDPGKRTAFCTQCHNAISHQGTSPCLDCHIVHDGVTPVAKFESEARSILKEPPIEIKPEDVGPFNPFVGSFNPFMASSSSLLRRFLDTTSEKKMDWLECYRCHNPGTTIENAYPVNFSQLHHPMGGLAESPFPQAKGTNSNNLINNQLTCISCHDDFHGLGPYKNIGLSTEAAVARSRANYFLRGKLITTEEKDMVDCCIDCHNDKSAKRNVSEGIEKLDGKHLVSREDSPNGRGGCMFCHYIHNQNPPASYKLGQKLAEVESLMRLPAKNLWWGSQIKGQGQDRDTADYEDLCFGCHGDPTIVGSSGANGSLLNLNMASHRFAIKSSSIGSKTIVNMSSKKEDIDNRMKFPLADGPEGKDILDDYGTESGQFFCGTCHNVHEGRAKPYLRQINRPGYGSSPYQDKGFCESCHDDGEFGDAIHGKIHPTGKGPNYPVTVATWPEKYIKGGSGEAGGLTIGFDPSSPLRQSPEDGEIICLTCHNVHACATTWDDKLPMSQDDSHLHGKLLVEDNYSESSGSNMCIDCHSPTVESSH
ncbi:MAG: cytochrome c3 family protein [bacterium]